MKKYLFALTLLLLLITSLGMVSSFAYTNENQTIATQEASMEEGRAPFADSIGWRYKKINDKWHKRQYNYSKNKWLGEWELV